MCTVTWILEDESFELFHNRDERRTRGRAEPPRLHHVEGVDFLAPVDGDFGGSWVAVNQRGVVLSLLNRYGSVGHDSQDGFTSRGLLVTELASVSSVAELSSQLHARQLKDYRPFSLLIAELGSEPDLWLWDGGSLERAEPRLPLVSSPAAERVWRSRREVLERERARRGGIDAELLQEYHRSHEPFRGPASVCMHHPMARTQSSTRVRVTPDVVAMEYRDGPPCTDPPVTRVQLERLP